MDDSTGNFNDNYAPTSSGVWRVSASWEGDTNYLGSSSVASLTVEKITHTLNLNLDSDKVTLGDKLTISGTLNPALSNATINLVLTDPNGNTEIKKIETL
jgi:hypothetical protein